MIEEEEYKFTQASIATYSESGSSGSNDDGAVRT